MSALGLLALAAGLLLIGRPGRPAARPRHREARLAAPATVLRQRLPWVGGVLTAIALPALAGRPGAIAALPGAITAGALLVRFAGPGTARAPDRRSVAFVLDLLASSLAAGAPPELAIASVSAAVAEHGTDSLRRAVEPLRLTGRLLQLGTDPVRAWSLLEELPDLASVAAAGRRCAHSGARLARALADAAADLREQHGAAAVARAERVGVWALLPLGCCFLPAFVCIGVLPVIAGVAGQVLGGG